MLNASLLLLAAVAFQGSPLSTQFDVRRFSLQVSPAQQTLILGNSVGDLLFHFSYEGALDENMRLQAVLLGPGLNAPLPIDVPARDRRMVLPQSLFTLQGSYRLTQIRLTRQGRTLAEASPRSANIEVVPEIVLTRVQVRELGQDELAKMGYVFREQDYRTVKFELTMVMGASEDEIEIPVAIPRSKESSFLPQVIEDPFAPPIKVKPILMVPMIIDQEKQSGGGGEADSLAYEIFSLLLIPGEFSYLRSHFEVTAIVTNMAGEQMDARIERLKAELLLPPATLYGRPLSLADQAVREVIHPGADGERGTPDDRDWLAPGEEGQVEYVVTGNVAGVYDLHARITGKLKLGSEQVEIQSIGRGRILVRDPEYSVTLEHPETVAEGEPYELRMQFHNQGNQALEGLSVTLLPQQLVGTELADANAYQTLSSLQPGEDGELVWQMRALVTGRVVGSYFKIEGGPPGELNLSLGVGSSGERLTPYSIVYPRSLQNNLPSQLYADLRRYAKKLFDFSQMEASKLPQGMLKPNSKQLTRYNEALGEAARLFEMGVSEREVAVRIFANWVRSHNADPAQDSTRREILDSGLALEASFGAWLGELFAADSARELLQTIADEQPELRNLLAFVVESDDTPSILVRDKGGRLSSNAGAREVPFTSFIPLGEGRTLVWVSDGNSLPWLQLSGHNLKVEILRAAPDGYAFHSGGPWNLDERASLELHNESGAFQFNPLGATPLMLAAEPTPAKPFALEKVFQNDPLSLPRADQFGRTLTFLLSKPLDLRSLLPLEEHLRVNGEPVTDALIALGGRALIVSARMPLGPYKPIRFELMGARDFEGSEPLTTSGLVTASNYFTGVSVAGRVIDHGGSDLSKARVFLYQISEVNTHNDLLDPRLEIFGSTGSYRVYHELKPAADGSFAFDFVSLTIFNNYRRLTSHQFKIGVELADGRYMEREYYPRGVSEEVQADIVFVALGDIFGYIRDSEGQPVANAPVFVVNQLSPLSAAQSISDGDGLYYVPNLAVGQVLVKSRQGNNIGMNSGLLTSDSSPLQIDLVIDNPEASVSGKVMFETHDGTLLPIANAFVGVLMNDTFESFASELSYGINFTAGTRTGADGSYRLEGIPPGQGHVLFYHPQYSLRERGVLFTSGENEAQDCYFNQVEYEGGSVSGVIVGPEMQPVAGARVVAFGNVVYSDSQGGFRFDSLPLNRDIGIQASHGGRRGSGSVYLDLQQRDRTQIQIQILDALVVSGSYVDADGKPRAYYPIYVYDEDATIDEGNMATAEECPPPDTYTDAYGHWSLPLEWGVSKRFAFVAYNPPLLAEKRNQFVDRTNPSPIELRELRSGSLRVSLQDPNGQATLGMVSIETRVPGRECETLGMAVSTQRSRATDQEGMVFFGGINAGIIRVTAVHPLLGTQTREIEILEGEELLSIRFEESELAALTGTVYDTDGVSPAPPGTKVFAKIMTKVGNEVVPVNASIAVDATGHYSFTSLVESSTPHNVQIVCYNRERNLYEEGFLILHNGLNFRFDAVLKNRGRVRVQVVHSDDTPADFAAVTLSYRGYEIIDGASGERVEASSLRPVDQITPEHPFAEFADVPAGEIQIKALGPNGLSGLRDYAMPLDGQDLEIRVRLEASSEISGTFIDHSELAIEGGEVQLRADNKSLLATQATGSAEQAGLFAFHDLPMRSYRLYGIDPQSGLTAEARVRTSPYQPSVQVVLKLDPINEVKGVLYDNEGQPVIGAELELSHRDFSAPLRTGTDAEGRYHFVGLKNGAYQLLANKRGISGKAFKEFVLENEPNGLRILDLHFEASFDLHLTLVNAEGRPASRVMVSYYRGDFGQHSQFTDAMGQVVLRDMTAGFYNFYCEDPVTLAELWETLSFANSTEREPERTLRFKGLGAVEGQVLDELGRPLRGAVSVNFSYSYPMGNLGFPIEISRGTITDVDGYYRMGGLPVEREIQVSAYDPTTYEWDRKKLTLSQHGEERRQELFFRASTSMSGIVQHYDGTPAKDAVLLLRDPVTREVYSDVNGHFTLAPLPTGDLLIEASDLDGRRQASYRARIQVNENGELEPMTDVVIRLSGVTELVGTARFADGTPLSQGRVALLDESGRTIQDAPIQGDGSYRFAKAPLGTWRIQALEGHYGFSSEPLALVLDEDLGYKTQDLDFNADFRLAGRVLRPDGTEIVGAGIELWSHFSSSWKRYQYGESNDQGYYLLNRLRPGRYRLVAYDTNKTFALQEEFEIDADSLSHDLSLAPQSWLTGSVENQAHRPFTKGLVKLVQSGVVRLTQIEPDGEFRFEGLVPGPYELSATLAEGWIQTDVHAGELVPGVNAVRLSSGTVVTLRGTAYLDAPSSHKILAYLVNPAGIKRQLSLNASGDYLLDDVPVNTPIQLVLRSGLLTQTRELGFFQTDAVLPTYTLDGTTPSITWLDENLTPELPWQLSFALSPGRADSFIDEPATRVWINDFDVTDHFHFENGQLRGGFTTWPKYARRGENVLKVRTFNNSHAHTEWERRFQINQEGTNLFLSLKYENQPIAGTVQVNDGPVLAVAAGEEIQIPNLPAGRVRVLARGGIYGTERTLDISTLNFNQSETIHLYRYADYYGRVLGVDGQPLADSLVRMGDRETRTDANGHYVFELYSILHGGLVEVNEAESYGWLRAPGLSVSAQTILLDDLQMRGLGAINGQVLDGEGSTQLAGLSVTLNYMDFISFLETRTTSTDANGAFRFENVWGFDYRLSVRDPLSGREATEKGRLDYPGDEDQVTLTLSPTTQLLGTAQDAAGVALAGVQVRLIEKGRYDAQTTSDAQGRFSFDRVPAGSCDLRLNTADGLSYQRLNFQLYTTNPTRELGAIKLKPNQAPSFTRVQMPTSWDPDFSLPIIFSSQDDFGIARVNLRLSGALELGKTWTQAESIHNSFSGSLDGLPDQPAEGSVVWTLEAEDLLGLTTTVTGSFEVRYDADGPLVSLLEPAAGTTLVEGAPLRIRAEATDSHGVDRIELYFGTQLLESWNGSPIQYDGFAPDVFVEGEVGFELRAYDGQDHLSVTPVNLRVTPKDRDGEAPLVQLRAPLDGMPLPIWLESGLEIQLAASLSDAGGLSRAQWLINDEVVAEKFLFGPTAEWNESYLVPESQRANPALNMTLVVTDLGGEQTRLDWVIPTIMGIVPTSNLSLSRDHFQYENQTLILDGGSHIIDGLHRFANLILVNGAVVRQSATDPSELLPAQTWLEVAGELVITPGSAFAADGTGYSSLPKPMSQGFKSSYGGLKRGESDPGQIYGSPFEPSMPGSCRGGGALRLAAARVWLLGELSARPPFEDSSWAEYIYGSGGSIWLSSEQIKGYGRVTANAYADGQSQYTRATGGGGRVAIYGDFAGRVEAFGGLGAGAGTVYRKVANAAYADGYFDQLELANAPGSAYGAKTPLPMLKDRLVGQDLLRSQVTVNGENLDQVDLINPALPAPGIFQGMWISRPGESSLSGTVAEQSGARLRSRPGTSFGPFADGDSVEINFAVDQLDVRDGAVLDLNGRLPLERLNLDNGGLYASTALDLSHADLNPSGRLRLEGSLTLGDLSSDGSLILEMAGEIRFSNLNLSGGVHELDGLLRAETLTVGAAATLQHPSSLHEGILKLDAPQMRIDGKVMFTPFGSLPAPYYNGHGGLSGGSSQTYDSFYWPSLGLSNRALSGAGGGLVQLVFDQLELNGTLDASSKGNSAGGSILLEGRPGSALSGSGTLDASVNHNLSNAGGGRIAVLADQIQGFSGAMRAYGGSYMEDGGAGTIYLRTLEWPNGKLKVDNGGRSAGVDSTFLPGIGSKLISFATGDGPFIRGENFEIGLVGLYAVVDGYEPVRIGAASANQLSAVDGANFPPVAPNSLIHGLHRLDVLEVTGSAKFYSPDPIELTQPVILTNGGSIGATVLREPQGSGTFSNGSYTISNQNFESLTLDAAQVVSEIPLQLNRIELRNGSSLTYQAPISVNEVTVDGATLIAKTLDGGMTATHVHLRNGGRWTVAARQANGQAWPLIADVTGTLTLDEGTELTTTGTNLAPSSNLIWGGGVFYTNAHGGYGSLDSYGLDSPLIGSFSDPKLAGPINGGGLIRLRVGELLLNGAIRADGTNTGAGGSIRLDAPLIRGTGTLSAKTPSPYRAGGRIAIYHGGDKSFLDQLQIELVQASPTPLSAVSALGGAGTLFLKGGADLYGELIVDQKFNGVDKGYDLLETRPRLSGVAGEGQLVLAVNDSDPDPYVIRDPSLTKLTPGLAGQYATFQDQGQFREVLILDNDYNSILLAEPVSPSLPAGTRIQFVLKLDRLVLRGGAQFHSKGIIEPGELVLEGTQLQAVWCRDLRLADTHFALSNQKFHLILDEPHWENYDISLNHSLLLMGKPLEIRDLALLDSEVGHGRTQYWGVMIDPVLDLKARQVSLDGTSRFDVSNKSDFALPYGSSPYSYGGFSDSHASIYGNPFAPNDYGTSFTVSSGAGGRIHLRAESLNGGLFRADASASGSGGSIWIEVENLTGPLTASANGKNGGGGRIAVLQATDLGATIQAEAKTDSNKAIQGPGSVYLRAGNQLGVLRFDNGQANASQQYAALKSFPAMALGNGFSASFDPATQKTRLLVPNLNLVTSKDNRDYLQDYSGYWLALNGDPQRVFRILSTATQGALAAFELEGDLGTLALGDSIQLALYLDELELCPGCRMEASDLLLLDDRAPWLESLSYAPSYEGQLAEDEPFYLNLLAGDHVQVQEVRATFAGQTNEAQGAGPHHFGFRTPPSPGATIELPLLVRVTDVRGQVYEQSETLRVGPLPAPSFGTELLLNPGAELVLDGSWTSESGTSTRTSASIPGPRDGASYFQNAPPGPGSTGALSQVVDLRPWRSAIDQGRQAFVFSGWITARQLAGARLQVSFRDGFGTELASWVSAANQAVNSWESVGETLLPPTGTREVRVRMESLNLSSSSLASFDALSLSPLPEIAVALPDLAVRALVAPASAILGSSWALSFEVANLGNRRETDLLFRLSDLLEGKSWEQSLASLEIGGTRTLTFTYNEPAPLQGLHPFRLELVPVSGETELADNSLTFEVELVRESANYGVNLLRNAEGDLPLPDGFWMAVGQTWATRSNSPSAASGSSYFRAANDLNAEQYQDLNLAAFTAAIDEGNQAFALSGKLHSNDGQDSGRMLLEYRDAAGQLLASHETDWSSVSSWQAQQLEAIAPAQARILRVRLQANRVYGTANDLSFDQLALVARDPAGSEPLPVPAHYWSFDTADDLNGLPLDLRSKRHSHFAMPYSRSNPGVRGQSYRFNNSTNRVVVDGGTDLDGLANLTLSCWISPTSMGSSSEAGIATYGTATGEAWSLFLRSNGQVVFRADGRELVSAPIQISQWLNLVVRFHAGEASLFINGDEVASAAWPLTTLPNLAGAWLELGYHQPGAAGGLAGYLDETALWREALSPAQIRSLFETWNGDLPDFRVPRPASELRATAPPATAGGLDLSWSASPNGDGDLAGYRIYLDGVRSAEADATALAYPLRDLAAGRAYRVALTSFDANGNESEAVEIPAATASLLPGFPNPSAYWTLDNTELNGSQTLDRMGRHHSNNHSLTAGQSGILGQAYRFTSSSHRLEFPRREGLWNGDSFSLSLWFLQDSSFAERSLLTYGSASQELLAIQLAENANRVQVSFGGATSGYALEAGFAKARDGRIVRELAKNRWTQLALVYDGNEAVLYLDGLEAARAQVPAALLADSDQAYLSLGRRPLQAKYDIGYLDEVMLWNQALGADRVAFLHQAWRGTAFDLRPPEPPTQLRADAASDSIRLSWTASVNTGADLVAYRLEVEGLEPQTLPAGTNQVLVEGLQPATRYEFRLIAIDQNDNRSAPARAPFATLPSDDADFPRPQSYYSFNTTDHVSNRPLDLRGLRNANLGTISSLTAGVAAESFKFTSSSHKIEMPSLPSFFGGDRMSMSFWFNASSFAARNLLSFGNAQKELFSVELSSTSGQRLELKFNGGGNLNAGGSLGGNGLPFDALTTGSWHHVLFSYDQGQVQLYLNGVLAASAAWPSELLNGADQAWLSIGPKTIGGNYYLGNIDELLVWDSALTPAEAALVYQLGLRGEGFRQGTLDLTPPDNARNLKAQAESDSLLLTWSASANADGDLDAYLIEVDGVEVARAAANETQFLLTGLSPEQNYRLRLIAVDHKGNRAAGVEEWFATLPESALVQPLSYWSFDSEDRVGTQVRDLVGPNHSTSGSASYTLSGMVGNTLGLISTGYWLQFANPALNLQNGMTVQLWFLSTTTNSNRSLLGFGTSTQNLFRLSHDSTNGNRLRFEVADGATIRTLESPVQNAPNGPIAFEVTRNVWHQVAVSFADGEARLFLDGVELGSASWPLASLPTATSPALTLGRKHSAASSADGFVGHLDEVAIWDQALSPAQIRAYRQRGMNGQKLISPTSNKFDQPWLKNVASFEDPERIMLVGEALELVNFQTEKALWLSNTHLKVRGQLAAAEIHLLDGSLIEAEGVWSGSFDEQQGREGGAASLRADLIQIESGSAIHALKGADLGAEVQTRVPDLGLYSQYLLLDGEIRVQGQDETAGALLVETRLLFGTGLIEVSAPSCGGSARIRANNADSFEGQIRTGLDPDCHGWVELETLGQGPALRDHSYPMLNPQRLEPGDLPQTQNVESAEESGASAPERPWTSPEPRQPSDSTKGETRGKANAFPSPVPAPGSARAIISAENPQPTRPKPRRLSAFQEEPASWPVTLGNRNNRRKRRGSQLAHHPKQRPNTRHAPAQRSLEHWQNIYLADWWDKGPVQLASSAHQPAAHFHRRASDDSIRA